MQQRTESEWIGFENGRKKNVWAGQHLRSWQSTSEFTDRLRMGARRKAGNIDVRNGIWTYSPGDKSYKDVTRSSDYFRIYGTCISPPNFGEHVPKTDTFIPLLPETERFDTRMGSFVVRERERRLEEERREVRSLNEWQPAIPLGAQTGGGPGGSSIVSGGAGSGSGAAAVASIGGPSANAMGTTGGSVLSGVHTASIISGTGLAHTGGATTGGGTGTSALPALSRIGSTPTFQD